jgi:hypothetical protein
LYCSNLTSAIIPPLVTTIGRSAFNGCNNITSLNFESPDVLKTIGIYAFQECSKLTTLIIPSSVTSILNSAFNWCSGLTSIYANPYNPIDLTNINSSDVTSTVFGGLDKNTCKLYVPFGSLSLYQQAVEWKDFTNILEMPGFKLSANTATIPPAGGTASVYLTTTAPCSIISDQNWLNVSSASISTNGYITLSASGNAGAARQTTVTVSSTGLLSQTITVSQDSLRKTLILGSKMDSIAPSVESASTLITSNKLWEYFRFIPSQSGTYTFTSASKSDPKGKLFDSSGINSAGNDDYNGLDFYFTFNLTEGQLYYFGLYNYTGNSKEITVNIEGGGLQTFLYTNKKTLSISAAKQSNSTVELTTKETWTAASNQTWLVVSPTGGTGNQALTFNVESNPSISARNAVVTISAPGVTSQTIKVTQQASIPPVANAGADKSVCARASVTLDGSLSLDADGNTLTYKWTVPQGITLNSATDTKPTFTAPKVSVKTDYPISLVVNNGSVDSQSDIVIVTVNPLPETAGTISGSITVCKGQSSVVYTVPTIADATTYVWTLPEGSTGESTTNSITVDYGLFAISGNITVKGHNDCGDGAGTTLAITVNTVPVANAGPAQSINELTVATLDGSGSSDFDGNALTYKWSAPVGITLSDLTVAKPTFTAPEVKKDTAYTISLIVNDGLLDSPADTVVIEVKNVSSLQEIPMIAGWNIISTYVIPANVNMKDIFQSMINSGKLKKVMDEAGKTVENFGIFGGWKNNIGNLFSTEGYKVNMLVADTLRLEGILVSLPLGIPLTAGWNIISYPSTTLQDGKALVQSLIDAGKITKVMDESGKTIENFGIFGGWKNNIGNFVPGKGYKVKVASDTTLTIPANPTKAAAYVPEVLASTHFAKAFEGNGTDHMNVSLVDLQTSGLEVSDEIGIFDGKYCVGSATIGMEQIKSGAISIPASANEGNGTSVNGFTTGNTIGLQLYRGNQSYTLATETLSGAKSFEKNGSVFIKISASDLPIVQVDNPDNLFTVYPNPFTTEITIEVWNNEKTEVDVAIYSLLGQRIKNLYNAENEGQLLLKWDGTNDSGQKVVPGIYLCKVNNETKKVFFKDGK